MADQNAQSGPYVNFLVGAAETALADSRAPNDIYDEVFHLFFRRYTTEQAIKLATLVHALREALTFTVERNIEDRAQRTTLHDFNAGAISKDGKIEPEALAKRSQIWPAIRPGASESARSLGRRPKTRTLSPGSSRSATGRCPIRERSLGSPQHPGTLDHTVARQ